MMHFSGTLSLALSHREREKRYPVFATIVALLLPLLAQAQWPYQPPPGPDSQRNAYNTLKSQVNLFQNTARSAPNYGEQGFDNVSAQFQSLRGAYGALKQTLTPNQLAKGANSLAELDAGLDILQEAFANFQNDVAAGRPVNSALRDMCEVLRQGSQVWAQELYKRCSQLRVGFGFS